MSKNFNGEYTRLRELSDLSGDDKSCSVIALAAALDLKYAEAQKALGARGRKLRRGATVTQICMALTDLGVDYFAMGPARFVDGLGKHVNTLTINNCTKVLPKERRWLVVSRDHIVAVKNGEVIDWANGRKIHVEQVIDVTDMKEQ